MINKQEGRHANTYFYLAMIANHQWDLIQIDQSVAIQPKSTFYLCPIDSGRCRPLNT